jgi:hypothetical protein
MTVNGVALAPVPAAFVTLRNPDVAPAGTVAVICVFEFTTNGPLVPLNFTVVVPVKPDPEMVTDAPTAAAPGMKPLSFGSTAKLDALMAVPPGVLTLIGPVVVAGAVAVICVSEFTVKPAPTPLKRTDVAPVKLWPLITTDVPSGPDVGLKPEIVGITRKLVALCPVPAAFVTRIRPVVAPAGTVAVI